MPCRDSGPDPDEYKRASEASAKHDREVQEKINNLTRMLCRLCNLLTEQDYILDDEINKWYIKHKDWDKKRLAAAKERALKKLSDEEREALGLE